MKQNYSKIDKYENPIFAIFQKKIEAVDERGKI